MLSRFPGLSALADIALGIRTQNHPTTTAVVDNPISLLLEGLDPISAVRKLLNIDSGDPYPNLRQNPKLLTVVTGLKDLSIDELRKVFKMVCGVLSYNDLRIITYNDTRMSTYTGDFSYFRGRCNQNGLAQQSEVVSFAPKNGLTSSKCKCCACVKMYKDGSLAFVNNHVVECSELSVAEINLNVSCGR